MDSMSNTAITDYVFTLTLEEFRYEGGRGFGGGSSLTAQDQRIWNFNNSNTRAEFESCSVQNSRMKAAAKSSFRAASK